MKKIASSSSEVDDKKTSILSELDTATTNAINQINNKKTEVLQLVSDNNLVTNDAFTDFQNDIQESIDETLEEYKSQVDTIYDDFQSILDNLNWQKYKLTQDNGKTLYDSSLKLDFNDTEQLESLGVGTRYIVSSINSPTTTTSNNGWLTKFDRGGIKLLEFRPYNSSQIFIKRYYNTWSDWEKVNTTQSDTGWLPFQLINGAAANTAFKDSTDNGFDCAYRTEKRGNVTEKSIRINASKVSNLQQIAQLPEGFVKNVQFHYVRVPINQGYGLVGIFPSGAVYVYIETDKRDGWDSTSQSYYFYGEFSFKE